MGCSGGDWGLGKELDVPSVECVGDAYLDCHVFAFSSEMRLAVSMLEFLLTSKREE